MLLVVQCCCQCVVARVLSLVPWVLFDSNSFPTYRRRENVPLVPHPFAATVYMAFSHYFALTLLRPPIWHLLMTITPRSPCLTAMDILPRTCIAVNCAYV